MMPQMVVGRNVIFGGSSQDDGTREKVRALAAVMIPEILLQREAKLTEFNEKHAADKLSYGFRCERFGDFLSLFISRGKEKYAGALNLGATQAITQNLGFDPDLKGVVSFTMSYGSSSSERIVRPVWEEDRHRALINIEAPPTSDNNHGTVTMGHWGHSGDEWLNGLRVADCPRVAQDDQIRFEGPRATIFTPAGLGAGVYDKILQAIAAGEHSP